MSFLQHNEAIEKTADFANASLQEATPKGTDEEASYESDVQSSKTQQMVQNFIAAISVRENSEDESVGTRIEQDDRTEITEVEDTSETDSEELSVGPLLWPGHQNNTREEKITNKTHEKVENIVKYFILSVTRPSDKVAKNGENQTSDSNTKGRENSTSTNVLNNFLCFVANSCDRYEFLTLPVPRQAAVAEPETETGNEENYPKETALRHGQDYLDSRGNINSSELAENLLMNRTQISNQKFRDQLPEQPNEEVTFSQKFQAIEMQLLRLENRLLSETLQKQDNAAGFAKLERSILKLENELLKINTSLILIQQENDPLKAKQLSESQMSELFNSLKGNSAERNEKYLSLADNSNALESVVDKQQSRIHELQTMVQNQTTFTEKLAEKSQRLEEENEQLIELLANQSKKLAQVMEGMETMKQEQETLKRTVTLPLPAAVLDRESSPDSATNPPFVHSAQEFNHKGGPGLKTTHDVQQKDEGLNVEKTTSRSFESKFAERSKMLELLDSEDLTPDEKLRFLRGLEKQSLKAKSGDNSGNAEGPEKSPHVSEETEKKRDQNIAEQREQQEAKEGIEPEKKTTGSTSKKREASAGRKKTSSSQQAPPMIPKEPRYYKPNANKPKGEIRRCVPLLL